MSVAVQSDDRVEILRVANLRTTFFTGAGRVQAVRDVSFSLRSGETLGIVGESGCGKSVTMASILGLLPDTGAVESGTIHFNGRDISRLRESQMEAIRGNLVGMIFQDPMTSLNPVFTVGDQLTEHLMKHKRMSRSQARQKAIEMLELVGIDNPAERLKSYPHQYSGGMRQRVMIAIALITDPLLLIADEPTTALDVTIQAQILELLKRLKNELDTAIILITHDLGVVADICDRVIVMYGGKIVEHGEVGDVYYHPGHPYTMGLLGSVPNPKAPVRERLIPIAGQPPDLLAPPAGCPFVPRCRHAMVVCANHMPPTMQVDGSHRVACWLLHPQANKPRPHQTPGDQP